MIISATWTDKVGEVYFQFLPFLIFLWIISFRPFLFLNCGNFVFLLNTPFFPFRETPPPLPYLLYFTVYYFASTPNPPGGSGFTHKLLVRHPAPPFHNIDPHCFINICFLFKQTFFRDIWNKRWNWFLSLNFKFLILIYHCNWIS